MKKPFVFHFAMVTMMIVMVAVASSSRHVSADIENPYSGYELLVNERPVHLETAPYSAEGTMMVPMREMAEAMGTAVEWDKGSQTASAVTEATRWEVVIGEHTAHLNGIPVPLEQPAALVKGTVMVPVRSLSEALGFVVKWDGIHKQVAIDSERAVLPLVGSYEKLEALVAPFAPNEKKGWSLFGKREMAQGEVAVNTETASMDSDATSGSADFSSTNVQVQGVDEGDVVKTDGRYIYQINRSHILITDAYPASELSIVSTIPLENEIHPLELYVDDTYMVVVAQSWSGLAQPAQAQKNKQVAPSSSNHSVKAIAYNIENKAVPVQLREVELEGHYIASRKIGGSFYLVTNQYMDVYTIMEGDSPAPAYRDTAASAQPISIGYDQMSYFPDMAQPNYLHIAGFQLERMDEQANVATYVGAGEQVYASMDHLYVTKTKYEESAEEKDTVRQDRGRAEPSIAIAPSGNRNSQLYKFRLNQGKVTFVAEGTVPGTPINQFAMDEHNGYFRIATTTGEMWRTDEHTSKNHVYILNEAMAIVGKAENIAPGETIYSVRFMGGRGYMVTFRTVDPLFALDLTNPESPRVLGALKIPGYSDYLHPYDENHLIGFGKDAVEVVQKDASGKPVGEPAAFYQGMKLALFDVSDVNNPIERFNELIGDRGTESELLYNHRALLFSKEKNLLAFPVTVAEVKDKQNQQNNPSQFGDFAFQGAYIYSLDPSQGFHLRGQITHLTKEDYTKAGQSWYDSDKNIQRILYIGDTLYTLSPSEIRASDLHTLQQVNSVAIPKSYPGY